MSRIRTTVALVGAASLSTLGFIAIPVSASASTHATCHGVSATIVGHGVVRGTSHRDVIVLTGPSVVYAGAGNDLICGSSGRDIITGGTGADVIFGNGGNDVENGGLGNDDFNLAARRNALMRADGRPERHHRGRAHLQPAVKLAD